MTRQRLQLEPDPYREFVDGLSNTVSAAGSMERYDIFHILRCVGKELHSTAGEWKHTIEMDRKKGENQEGEKTDYPI